MAIALPWSTSATAILLVIWLITLIPTLNLAAIWREVKTLVGGLPVLLWLLGAFGVLWADVSWPDRVGGLGSFHRLLMIPVLLAHFRRSKMVIGCFMAFSHQLLSCFLRPGHWYSILRRGKQITMLTILA